MSKKNYRRQSAIKNGSKQHQEFMQIKETLIKAKEMLTEAKEAMEKYAEENKSEACPLDDLIISKKD